LRAVFVGAVGHANKEMLARLAHVASIHGSGRLNFVKRTKRVVQRIADPVCLAATGNGARKRDDCMEFALALCRLNQDGCVFDEG